MSQETERDPGSSAGGPLRGLRVVSFEQAVAAPFATRQLADLGADVVKIEPPGRGDFARAYDEAVRGMSSFFVWLNRGKRSVALDPRHHAATPVIDLLLGSADVVVHNMSGRAAARLALTPDELRADRRELIAVAISGFGTGGPYSDRKAYDLLVQAEAGLLSVTGTAEQPVKVGASIADIAAGMYAFSGILAALVERGRTGSGASIEISMLDALAEWMGAQAQYGAHSGVPAKRTGAHHATIAPYGPYRTADGTEIFLAVQNDAEWQRLVTSVAGEPELADPRYATNVLRVRHRDDMDRLLKPALARFTGAQLCRLLDEQRIAWSVQRDVKELTTHPQLRARGRWVPTDSPVGLVETLALPGWPASTSPAARIPALGEHTDDVLTSLGLGAAAIAELRRSGALG